MGRTIPTALAFTAAPRPMGPKTSTQRAKESEARTKVERPEVWRKRKRKTNANHRRNQATTRQFILIDGEGIQDPNNPTAQAYALLAASTGKIITNENGLDAQEIIDFLFELKTEFPKAIFVVYGAGYDFNMWLRQMDKKTATTIKTTGEAEWLGHSWDWKPGKTLDIRKPLPKGVKSTTRPGVRIYDVLPFFQCSFVKACDAYLKDSPQWKALRETVIEGKKTRGTFTTADLPFMTEYCQAELELGVELMNALRSALTACEIYPTRWDGPGAIANALFKKKGVTHVRATPERAILHAEQLHQSGVSTAIRRAYAGGRFEALKCGIHENPAFQYDINSAYPHALRYVPCTHPDHGAWVHYEGSDWFNQHRDKKEPFALHTVSFSTKVTAPSRRDDTTPYPLWSRLRDGGIWYPWRINEGVYWHSETTTAALYAESTDAAFTVHSTWVWELNQECDNPYPLSFIPEMYAKRKEYKADGNAAEKGIKLGLNSMYGKLAQQVGWEKDPREPNHRNSRGDLVRIPPWHNLAWAGYTTAFCRALIMDAVLLDPHSIIAIETDAVFTTRQLPLETGTGLGQWEYTEYAALGYCQSGVSFYRTLDGIDGRKTRGVTYTTDQSAEYSLTGLKAKLADAWDNGYEPSRACFTTKVSHFISLPEALVGDKFDQWCSWVDQTKRIPIAPTATTSKRHYLLYGYLAWDKANPTTTPQLHEGLRPTDLRWDNYIAHHHYSNEHGVDWENPRYFAEPDLPLEIQWETDIKHGEI